MVAAAVLIGLTPLIGLAQAAASGTGVIDVTKGPVATTTVAVRVALDPEGRVVSCTSASGIGGACAGFPRGRVVSRPIRRAGKPVRGTMTVSTTSVVSGD